MEIKERIIFRCLFGSKLYGTDGPDSDTDIRGVFLPRIEDLALGRAPKCVQGSTGDSSSRNGRDDVDETYYSLQYFLELLCKGDTGAMDMLFAHTNPAAVLFCDPIFQELIDGLEHVVCRNVRAYMGYCRGQAVKYGMKGEKLDDFRKLESFCESHAGDACGVSLRTLAGADYGGFCWSLGGGGDRPFRIERTSRGGDCLDLHGVRFQLDASVSTVLSQVRKVIRSYGRRSEAALEAGGVDGKALSHCMRTIFQVEQLLTEGRITFPLKQADWIKDVKYGRDTRSRDTLLEWVGESIARIDGELVPKSALREEPDREWIDRYVLRCYGLDESVAERRG